MKKIILVVVILSMFLMSFGLASQLTFLLCPKSLNNPYWMAVKLGEEAAAKLVNVDAIFDGPVNADAAAQAAKIMAYIGTHVNGIGISPVDDVAIVPTIQEALKAGIPTITFDSDAAPNSGRYVYVGTDNYTAGYAAGLAMAQAIKERLASKPVINIAILTGGLAALNLNQRIQGFKDALAAANLPNKINYVASPFPCNDDTAQAINIIKSVMAAYPDLDAWFMSGGWPLFAPVDTFTSAMGGVDKAKQIITVSFDTLMPELQLVKDGYVTALIGQKPYEMGYLSVMILYDMNVFGVNETLKMLPIVQEPYGKDHIIDTGVNIVTQSNVDQFIKEAPLTGGYAE
ncbi:MAG: sugar-binding protein [Conexivisphaerales archaeon]